MSGGTISKNHQRLLNLLQLNSTDNQAPVKDKKDDIKSVDQQPTPPPLPPSGRGLKRPRNSINNVKDDHMGFGLITSQRRQKDPAIQEKILKKSFTFLQETTDPNKSLSSPLDSMIKFKLEKLYVESATLQQSLESRKQIYLSNFKSLQDFTFLFKHNRVISPKLGDVYLFAVVCHIWKKQIEGGNLNLIKMSDLDQTSICLVLESEIIEKHSSISFGDVIGILNPDIISSTDGEGVVLKLRYPSQLVLIGSSSEIGYCAYDDSLYKSFTKLPEIAKPVASKEGCSSVSQLSIQQSQLFSNSTKLKCPNFVNRFIGDLCSYHMFEIYQDSKSKRMNLNDSNSATLSYLQDKQQSNDSYKDVSIGSYQHGKLHWKISHAGIVIPTAKLVSAEPESSNLCVLYYRFSQKRLVLSSFNPIY